MDALLQYFYILPKLVSLQEPLITPELGSFALTNPGTLNELPARPSARPPKIFGQELTGAVLGVSPGPSANIYALSSKFHPCPWNSPILRLSLVGISGGAHKSGTLLRTRSRERAKRRQAWLAKRYVLRT